MESVSCCRFSAILVMVVSMASIAGAEPGFVELALRSRNRTFVYPNRGLSRAESIAWRKTAESFSRAIGRGGAVVPSTELMENTTGSLIILGNPETSPMMASELRSYPSISVTEDLIVFNNRTFDRSRHPDLLILLGGNVVRATCTGRFVLFCISFSKRPEIRCSNVRLSMHRDFTVADRYGLICWGNLEYVASPPRFSFDWSRVGMNSRRPWKTVRKGMYEYCVRDGSLFFKDGGWLAAFQSKALKRLCFKYKFVVRAPIRFYTFEDRDDIERCTGRSGMGFVDPIASVVYAIYGPAVKGAIGSHEIAHVLLEKNWGRKYPGGLIDEGCAEATALSWDGKGHINCVRELISKGTLPSLLELATRWDEIPASVSYPVAACFINFVLERFGLDHVERIYRNAHRHKDGSWFDAYLGASASVVQKPFEAWVQGKD